MSISPISSNSQPPQQVQSQLPLNNVNNAGNGISSAGAPVLAPAQQSPAPSNNPLRGQNVNQFA